MSVLVTGGSGFLGGALIDRLLAKGDRVISVSRHPPELKENMVALVGDILVPNLGLDNGILHDVSQGEITAVYHLAGIVNLGKDKDGSIFSTNASGTGNVIEFCVRHKIPHLFYCSSAYTQGRNPYEKSKLVAESKVTHSDIPSVTIFKPSIIVPMPQGNFSQWVSLLIKVHRRAETIRRKIEGTMLLPVIEPVFRIKGNPEGRLNLITVDEVADAMAAIKEPGKFWLTHPSPLTLQEILSCIGEYLLVNLRFEPEFKATPLEAVFARLAGAFAPYLQGDDFPSDLKGCAPVTREFIHETVSKILDFS